MDNSVVINNKELDAYNGIRGQFSGLTLQEAYSAIVAVKNFLEVISENIDDANAFIFS